MLNLKDEKLAFALQAVCAAAELVRQIQQELVTPAMTKDDRSPVTIADFASQALVAWMLAEAFPAEALIGEESASALQQPGAQATLAQVTGFVKHFAPQADSQAVCAWIDRGGAAFPDATPQAGPSGTAAAASPARYWTLDPIDGTKGFLRGDQYVVALALVEQGQVQIGVLGCPNLRDGYIPDLSGPGSLVAAQRGFGTWTTPLPARGKELGAFRQLHVSERRDPTQARLLRSFEAGHTNVEQIDQLIQMLGVQAAAVRMDSQAKYAILAAGAGEVSIRLLSPEKPNYREKIWDQAAGSLIVEEAGGRITDLDGSELRFTAGRTLAHNRGVLATNGQLHPRFLQALRDINA